MRKLGKNDHPPSSPGKTCCLRCSGGPTSEEPRKELKGHRLPSPARRKCLHFFPKRLDQL